MKRSSTTSRSSLIPAGCDEHGVFVLAGEVVALLDGDEGGE
jgi:hypothetical protein